MEVKFSRKECPDVVEGLNRFMYSFRCFYNLLSHGRNCGLMWAYLSSLTAFLTFHLRCRNITGHRKVMSLMKRQLGKLFSEQFQPR